MAAAVVVPRLGWTMEEGVFTEWLKKDGDAVKEGDPLFLLEGEKSVEEIPAVDSGILRIPPHAPKPGETVKVGATVAYLTADGEAPPWEAALAPVPTTPATPTTDAAKRHEAARIVSATGLRARRIAIDNGQTVPSEPARISSPNEEPRSSPRARRVAKELGVDWRSLAGTGKTGRIREQDVRAARPSSVSTNDSAPGTTAPLTPIRRTIAKRMSAGVHEAAPVTLVVKLDASRLVELRRQFKAVAQSGDGFVPTITDLIVKLSAQALAEHPQLNSQWRDEGIFHPEGIHVGVAVDTEAGLVVPVIRDVNSRSLRELSAETRRLAEKARARRLTADDSSSGTFTISNLGMFGVDAFTPILHLPQCAILGVGRIVREPAVVDDRIEPREQMTVSLTFDHRVVDGAPAARCLDSLRRRLEQPSAYLVG